jgi:Peptidase family M28
VNYHEFAQATSRVMSRTPVGNRRPIARALAAKTICLLAPTFIVASSVWSTRGYAGDDPRPEQGKLRAIVETLAAPDFGGRSGAGGEKAGEYLVERFRTLKLPPLFGQDYLQAIPGKDPGSVQGRNVGAILQGTDPLLRDENVILAAHFDHLGSRRGRLYPGADDNASGVAMMLETARSMVQKQPGPRRSVLFIGFDLEEVGLYGSRYFVAHQPVPLEKVVLFVTADMIGRALAGVCERHVFVIGSEHAPAVRPWIDSAARGRPLEVGLLGADLLVLNRSDYGPFRSRSIPFLFFTTGENPRYHTPNDTAETLDYPKLTAISQMIHQVVVSAADADSVPRWQANPEYPFGEAVVIRDVLGILAKNSDALKIGGPQRYLIDNTLSTLEGILARKTITPDERSRVIQAARIVLFTVL